MTVEDIYMGLIVTDNKEAGVIFPDNKGSMDWNYALFSENPDFVLWVEKNFWDMYNAGNNFLKMSKQQLIIQ